MYSVDPEDLRSDGRRKIGRTKDDTDLFLKKSCMIENITHQQNQ